jgi:hypothetical protein
MNIDPFDEDDDPSEYDDYHNVNYAELAEANRAQAGGRKTRW